MINSSRQEAGKSIVYFCFFLPLSFLNSTLADLIIIIIIIIIIISVFNAQRTRAGPARQYKHKTVKIAAE